MAPKESRNAWFISPSGTELEANRLHVSSKHSAITDYQPKNQNRRTVHGGAGMTMMLAISLAC